jgi:hypothetical protein
MTRTIKAEYMPGGEKRQEMLDKARPSILKRSTQRPTAQWSRIFGTNNS